MFSKLLIANRGEIACRIIDTAQRLGIHTVAVFSDADRQARHVRLADEAVPIGPATARDSYLNSARIINAAKISGVQAIHPGYGFLSEQAAFAQACVDAGLVFVGPAPRAIAAMGDKAAAKARMEQAGVPVVPGYHGQAQTTQALFSEAQRVGYPLIIKACAGGGGKGMRVVTRAEDFIAALARCRHEALSAFGHDSVLLERYLQHPRHIEVQIFADSQGHVVSLFERDCSIQRRHQKVIEEAPAPGLSPTQRQAMYDAATRAAKAIDYVGAGTIEFISTQDGAFYFMEMNTRLQVEHPVTEMITGLDLVEWQLRVAAGEALPCLQHEIHQHGHAIEVRIYAEDPARDFLPQTGRIAQLDLPSGEGIRIDRGIDEGDVMSAHYDPMMAKLIVHAVDRAAAIDRLQQAIGQTRVAGLINNLDFLARLTQCPAFKNAALDTGLIARESATLQPIVTALPTAVVALCTWAFLHTESHRRQQHAQRSTDPYSPWASVHGWRLNAAAQQDLSFVCAELETHTRVITDTTGHVTLHLDNNELALNGTAEERQAYQVQYGDQTVRGHVIAVHDRTDALPAYDWHVFIDAQQWRVRLKLPSLDGSSTSSLGACTAPMPGKIIAVHVAVGERVSAGTPLMVLEAMKMEHTITAPHAGTVEVLYFSAGAVVQEGVALFVLA